MVPSFLRRDQPAEESSEDEAAQGDAPVGPQPQQPGCMSEDSDFEEGRPARKLVPVQQGTAFRSPPRKKKPRAAPPPEAAEEPAPARRRGERRPEMQRQEGIDREWTAVSGGRCVRIDDLPSFLEAYFLRKAAGAGFTPAGAADRPGKNGTLVSVYKCKHKDCPALVQVVKHDAGMCGGRLIASVEKACHKDLRHNDHFQDAADEGVPNFVKALLSPLKLQMKPGRLRSWLRDNHADVVLTLPLRKALLNLHNKESKKVGIALPLPSLTPPSPVARSLHGWLARCVRVLAWQLGVDWPRGDEQAPRFEAASTLGLASSQQQAAMQPPPPSSRATPLAARPERRHVFCVTRGYEAIGDGNVTIPHPHPLTPPSLGDPHPSIPSAVMMH